jgi:hypothetical protein
MVTGCAAARRQVAVASTCGRAMKGRAEPQVVGEIVAAVLLGPSLFAARAADAVYEADRRHAVCGRESRRPGVNVSRRDGVSRGPFSGVREERDERVACGHCRAVRACVCADALAPYRARFGCGEIARVRSVVVWARPSPSRLIRCSRASSTNAVSRARRSARSRSPQAHSTMPLRGPSLPSCSRVSAGRGSARISLSAKARRSRYS